MRVLCASVLAVSATYAACNGGDNSGNAKAIGSGAPVTKHGSAGGFSASLSAEMAADPGAPAASGGIAAAGSAVPAAAAVAAPAPAGSAAASPVPSHPVDKSGAVTNHDISNADTNATGPQRPSDKYVHVNPPPELAAIKLDMEPNWDRDYADAGTISFVLRVPNSTDTRVFSFNYGYDYAGAPSDRDAYKKFLADRRVLDVTLDRQRGAAWYLEGTDAAGQPGFRYLVLYGGKRLVCYGSLYKTRDATALGADLRDKVVSTAKKICETIAL